MKIVPCGNPQYNDLKKSEKKRNGKASNLKKVIKNGLKYCAWCAEVRVSGNRKYCTDACRDNCYAFVNPQKEWGLEYHLQIQNFKCAKCKFDYMPIINKITKKYEESNMRGWSESYEPASPYFFGRLKYNIELKEGRGKKPEVDHVIPIALGGETIGFDNHQVLCYDCHKLKTKEDISNIAQFRRENGEEYGI